MGDTRCAAGCKNGLLPNGEECGACDGHGRARHGMPASQRHRHICEVEREIGSPCAARGYHVCKCGATKGVASSSEWIKSGATRDAHKFLAGYPFL